MTLRSRATTLLIWLLLAALAAVCVWSVLPPSPRGADAPADEFSAERAFTDVERVGAEVHPHGTPANDAVREYLVDRLTGLGLEPEVVDGVGMSGRLGDQSRVAATQNVVATIPGADPTAPIFLVAHYDSAEVSHGGNDDGAGVAAILETVRALGVGPALRNDVVVVLTDAEEACLCGAEAFVDADPRAVDGGIVLNFEARGSSGPAVMFETSPGNAALVDAYASVPYPVGSSLAVEVYRILPNDTDFSPFLDDPAGRFTGLNAAYIDGSATYHSPQDTPERMSLASLQHHGSNALALVRTLGGADATALAAPSASDATYFPLPGGILARYPGWLVWPLALAALGAVVVLGVVLARRRDDGGDRLCGPGQLALGFLAGVLPLAGAVLGSMGLWWVMTTVRPGYDEMLDPWQPWGFRVALLGLVALVVTGWFVALRRWLGTPTLVVGALGWLAVLGVALAALAPGGSYLATLPALAGTVAGLVALRLGSERARGLAVALGAAVGVVLLAPIAVLFFPALGLATGAAPAVVAVLLGLALVPVLALTLPPAGRAGGGLVGACALLTLGALGVGFAVDSFDADHPEPTRLAYALNTDWESRAAMWVSTEETPSDWTAQYASSPWGLDAIFPMLGGSVWAGPAEATDLPAPTVEVVDDVTSGDERTVTLLVRPGEGAPIGTAGALRYIELSDGHLVGNVLAASVAGRAVPVADDGLLDVRFYAPDVEGFEATVTVPAGDEVQFQAVAAGGGLDGLPGFVARPDGVGVAGSHTSELVLVATTVVL